MEVCMSNAGLRDCDAAAHSKSALAAMSGGVDSTVAAMLALRSGFDCEGAIMKLRPDDGVSETDAGTAAAQLGISFHVFDFSDVFSGSVIERFIDAYRKGRTPNPCVDCNKHLKFGCFQDKARELGKDFIITGHYARIERGADGRFLLKKGADPEKDQSYVLYGLTQNQLAHTILPLGGLSKRQVRELALDAGLENAYKRESQDICFVSGGNYAAFIEEYTGQALRKGRFVDIDGNYLGENSGVARYTIGQRRGLGLAMPYPVYVLDINPENDTVVVGSNELLYSKTLAIRDVNLISADNLASPIRARVKIRYKHSEQPATIHQTDNDAVYIEFDEPQRAITKGQAAVIYDGDVVIGGGTIA